MAVISNGTAVLGLGDIGALAGKPVMEGKGLLFKIFADIDVFDIEIDEKDPEKFIQIVKGKMCIRDRPRELIYESGTAFSFYDKFPVSLGHALILPKRLISNYFDLSIKEQMACWIMVNKVKGFLLNRFNPDGFNIGINIQETAGQSVPHCHIHVMPRYFGDVESPRGGVRGVIPGKQNY